jgi:hypothetical protein
MTGQEKGDHASQPLKVKNQVMTCDETLSAYFFFLNKDLMLSHQVRQDNRQMQSNIPMWSPLLKGNSVN